MTAIHGYSVLNFRPTLSTSDCNLEMYDSVSWKLQQGKHVRDLGEYETFVVVAYEILILLQQF